MICFVLLGTFPHVDEGLAWRRRTPEKVPDIDGSYKQREVDSRWVSASVAGRGTLINHCCGGEHAPCTWVIREGARSGIDGRARDAGYIAEITEHALGDIGVAEVLLLRS